MSLRGWLAMSRATIPIAVLRRVLTVLLVASVLSQTMAGQSRKQKRNAKKSEPVSLEDSTIIALQRESVVFFELWNKLWMRSQTSAWTARDGKKYAAPFRQSPLRAMYQHCHAPGFRSITETGQNLPGEYAPVRSASAFSVCPTWLLSDNGDYIKGLSTNEADDIDATIGLSLVDTVRKVRAQLIQKFDRAQQLLPLNSAITGQRVRFLLDQQLRDSALAVAQSCTGDTTFCLLLQGYAEVQRGNVRQASSLFNSATRTMSNAERCGWRDIATLMPDSTRANYALLSCTPRKELSALYWWLADPLYSDSVNERLVENDARTVRMMLLSALPRDGRFFYGRKDFSPEALTKLVMRYGWPTYLAWGGQAVDQGHNGWLISFHADTQPPYTTYEYSKGRIHTASSLATLYAPLSATDSSWELNDPKLKDRDANWWPEEFMVRARPLVTLPSYQIAMLRRESDILLASAHDVSAPAFASLRTNGVASLMVTPGPDTIIRIESRRVNNALTIRMRGRIASARTMFAMEIRDSIPLGIDARTRIGIEPPVTLSAMKHGDIALSDPVLLQLPSGDAGPLEPGEALLSQMLGSTTISLAQHSRVGVFFESYGVREVDTVTVSVTVRRRESVSAVRRLGMLLNVAGDPNASVTISWSEPNFAHVTRTVDGTVPIQSRAISIDLSALTPGPYELVTGIRRGSQPEVTSNRRLSVVK